MFDHIKNDQINHFNKELERLETYCETYPDIKTFVEYILSFNNDPSQKTQKSLIGREIIQQIYLISRIDLSGIGNHYHFNLSWVSDLNSFIGNYFFDDASFDFIQNHRGVFEFKSSNTTDDSRWFQDPMIIIEAAKANREYYNSIDNNSSLLRNKDFKVNDEFVYSIIK